VFSRCVDCRQALVNIEVGVERFVCVAAVSNGCSCDRFISVLVSNHDVIFHAAS